MKKKKEFSNVIITFSNSIAILGMIILTICIIMSMIANEPFFEVFVLGIAAFVSLGIGIIYEMDIRDRCNCLICKNPQLKLVFEQKAKVANKEKWYWFLGIVVITAIVIVTKIWWIAPAIVFVSLCWNIKWLRFIKSLEGKR